MRRRGKIRRASLLLALVVATSANAQLPASDLRLSLLIANDYRHNGLSQSHTGAAARFSVDYARAGGFFAGGFVANVEYAAERYFREPRELELNVYAGYQWQGRDWSTNLQISHYVYPDIEISYDYSLATVNFALRDRYFLALGSSDDYLGLFGRSYEARAGVALPLPHALELGINTGRFEATEIGDTKYSFWDLGISRVLGRYALDLRYHGNDYDGESLYGDAGDHRFVLSVAYSIRPRPTDRDRR